MIYSAESYLDDCLRLRGGVAPDEHTNRAVREVLSDLAAARREVETVTRERDEARREAKCWRYALPWLSETSGKTIDEVIADYEARNG